MPELGGRTQGPGKYSKAVCRSISLAWNAEILWIIEVPVGFSVANTGAGAKNGIFGQRCNVLSTK
jgi:hypothetical protein